MSAKNEEEKEGRKYEEEVRKVNNLCLLCGFIAIHLSLEFSIEKKKPFKIETRNLRITKHDLRHYKNVCPLS